jgi:putative resolvase
MVSEIGSRLNGGCPKFLKLLTDSTIGVIVVEHRDSRTRFGFPYIEQLLAMQGDGWKGSFPRIQMMTS